MGRGRAGKVLSSVVALALMSGCQTGGERPEREGYFSWVDERGRVQYSRIPESQPEESKETLSPSEPVSDEGVALALETAAEYTADNYPDGNELAKNGFVRPGQRQPYFTWLDADGVVRVSYFTPDTRGEVQKKGDNAPVTLTEASVYLPSGQEHHAPVEGYDPDAFAILGIADTASFFSVFAQRCCEQLPARDFQEWQEGREFGVRFEKDTPRHRFSTGDSPYKLIALPSGAFVPGFVMRIRSYEQEGVLVPSLAFLDKNLKPLRVVTDLVFDYQPESWHKRGYLEGWVPAFPGQGERWLVLYTRPQDLAGQTTLDSGSSVRAVPHTTVGELGIATFEDVW
ncbi:hypothetical protein KUV44_03220 [Marinobacter daepoensis]|uniref:Maltose operon substrate-binding protein (MalM) n=1 Tax=Marinobacter daepoensis TaxID=262077 RepID=A0ABS3BCU0_9GAMM|nr:MalM family protein [Marinobacter daepoensis]MBN7769454.1 hypothetical protein [Marinobacter daepoensis]MBY6031885.1 hypothetical protein [Marinobacter daepoensis]MBY6078144.1 hypothetical protein [Marinobacter daepoensis]